MAVHEIISTLNQLAQARLPGVRWRGGSFDAARLIPAGWMRASSVAPRDREALESLYAQAGPEPLLEEVLGDPVVQLIMRADRLEPGEVRRLLDAARRPLTIPVDPGAICPQ